MSDKKSSATTPEQIERELREARARLETTVNELAYRAQPKVIANRQAEVAKVKFADATRTPEGDLRMERIGAVVGGAVAFLVLVALLKRRRR